MAIQLQVMQDAHNGHSDGHDHGGGCCNGSAVAEDVKGEPLVHSGNPKILFVMPPSVGDFFSAQVPHVGVGYLIAMMKRHNIKSKALDMRLDYTTEDLLKVIDEFQPDIVGFSLFSLGFGESIPIINAVKEHSDKYKVMLGGPHISAVKKKAMQDTKADAAVFGEGEFTMIDICNGKRADEIPGLIWRNGENIIENPPRPYIQDLDSLPLPDYEEFEMEKYLCYPERHLPIVTSRGCPYQCTYCSVRLSMGMQFRTRSPKNVTDELEHWNKQGWTSFEVHDDNFTLDIPRAVKICEAIIERKLDITWKIDNGIRADRVTKELLQRMKDAGCSMVAFGVESGRQKVLKAMKKSLDIEKVKIAAEMAKEVGITVGATFIIGHPGETYEDFLESMKLAETLPVDQIIFYNIVPYPGTELYELVEKMQDQGEGRFLMDKERFLEQVAHWKNNPIFETKEFPQELRKKAYKQAYKLHQKKMLEFKLGKRMGSAAWHLAQFGPIDKMAHKMFLTPGVGRKIFNAVKKA